MKISNKKFNELLNIFNTESFSEREFSYIRDIFPNINRSIYNDISVILRIMNSSDVVLNIELYIYKLEDNWFLVNIHYYGAVDIHCKFDGFDNMMMFIKKLPDIKYLTNLRNLE